MEINFSLSNAKCKVIAHKYAVLINHPEISEPFKMVVNEVLSQDVTSLGWIASPEIQLRQTVSLKQEYIISNANSTPEQAMKECLFKMFLTEARDVFFYPQFEEQNNKLWES